MYTQGRWTRAGLVRLQLDTIHFGELAAREEYEEARPTESDELTVSIYIHTARDNILVPTARDHGVLRARNLFSETPRLP